MRYSSVWFDSNDHYVTPGNGDDSVMPVIINGYAGSLKYAMTDAGISIWRRAGFETPTINELSYRADGQSGMNLGLKPSTNDAIKNRR